MQTLAFSPSLALNTSRRCAGLRSSRVARKVHYRVLRVSATYQDTEKETQEEVSEKLNEYVDVLKNKWEQVDEKPAAIALGVAGIIGLWALNAVADAVDKIPLIGGGLELVGIFVTSWFVYRFLLFGPDREELKGYVEDFLAKVQGK